MPMSLYKVIAFGINCILCCSWFDWLSIYANISSTEQIITVDSLFQFTVALITSTGPDCFFARDCFLSSAEVCQFMTFMSRNWCACYEITSQADKKISLCPQSCINCDRSFREGTDGAAITVYHLIHGLLALLLWLVAHRTSDAWSGQARTSQVGLSQWDSKV